jgi:hypothetical protein
VLTHEQCARHHTCAPITRELAAERLPPLDLVAMLVNDELQLRQDRLLKRRVLIKNVSKMHPLLANCLRVTVSNPEENAQFLDAFAASLQEAP